MILTITQRGGTASELGYLLHKHPNRVNQFDLKFGSATVFFPTATNEVCTATLIAQVDPVLLVRSRGARQRGWALGQYVSDRPYAASSFLSVAIGRVLGSALNGKCAAAPDLADKPRNLEICLPAIAAPTGDRAIFERMFGPLDYDISADPMPLDPAFPDWGDSPYFALTLRTFQPLHRALKHLFILIPALDSAKHYWIGPDEIDKLLDKGKDWLADHPEKDWIATRYLKFRRSYAAEALLRLDPDGDREADKPRPAPLHAARLDRVAEVVAGLNPASVLDLGCGEGKLLARLLDNTQIPRITGVDADSRSLTIAKDRLQRDVAVANRDGRLTLLHGSLIYRDQRLCGYDAATLTEVIEHFDPGRLRAVERVVFQHAAPRHVILSTPNRDYNALFGNLASNGLRHPDHRFEWTRQEFVSWCELTALEHGYEFTIEPLGEAHPDFGAPSQLALFTRQ